MAGERQDAPLYRASLGLAALTCALTPAYVVRWHYGFYPTTLLENAILLTVAVFLVESWRQGTLPDLRSPLTVPVVLFLVAGAISVVVAPDRRAALGIYRAYLMEPVAFFYVLASLVRTPRRAALVMLGLAAAGVVAGMANSVVILEALRHHVLNITLTPPVVIYQTANAIALFLVPLIAIASALVLYERDRRVRLASTVFLLIAIISTLISFSRGGYLALAAVAFGVALSHPRRLWLLAGAGAAAALLLVVEPVRARVLVELDLSNPTNTLVGRFNLWGTTLQMLSEPRHLLVGAGLSAFSTALAPYWNPTHADRFIYPHNIFLTFWSETGPLGLFAFSWIVVGTIVLAWRGWRGPASPWRPLHLGVLLAMLAVIVHGQVDVPYFKNDLSLEFWTIVGLGWAAKRWAANAEGGWRLASGSRPARAASAPARAAPGGPG